MFYHKDFRGNCGFAGVKAVISYNLMIFILFFVVILKGQYTPKKLFDIFFPLAFIMFINRCRYDSLAKF